MDAFDGAALVSTGQQVENWRITRVGVKTKIK